MRSDAYMGLIKPTRLLSFQPHMHDRGKAECLEAIYPSGKTEMLSCARFEFNWMDNYVYADDSAPLLPAGTILHTIMWHDNSEPADSILIRTRRLLGERTIDEMGSAWLSYYYMSDEDFKKETEERKAEQRTLTSQALMLKRDSSQPRYGLGVCATVLLFGAVFSTAFSGDHLPGIRYRRGQDVSPTFDGWESNADGTFSMYFGYFNRNSDEEIDIPIGPENSFDLGNGDQGQPTHFYPGTRWWVFKVVVPKDWAKTSGWSGHSRTGAERIWPRVGWSRNGKWTSY